MRVQGRWSRKNGLEGYGTGHAVDLDRGFISFLCILRAVKICERFIFNEDHNIEVRNQKIDP